MLKVSIVEIQRTVLKELGVLDDGYLVDRLLRPDHAAQPERLRGEN